MAHYHDQTVHTYDSVRIPNFLDWDTQPGGFKRYPAFYRRFPFSTLPLAEFWPLLGSVTAREPLPGGAVYTKRTVPSAGALYPFELYLQIRGIPGIIEGVYHYETATDSLVLLHPVESDGVEPWLGMNRFNGIIFLVACPWFRTAWKYRNRSFRYCGLDTGHQIGAIEAACTVADRPFALLTGFDKPGLNARFGFEDKELFFAAALSGTEGEKAVKPLSIALPHVLPTNYHEPRPVITEAYDETLCTETASPRTFPAPYPKEGLAEAIMTRRSIRAFYREAMEAAELDALQKAMGSDPAIDVYALIHPRCRGTAPGLYKNGVLIKGGDFTAKAGYLCLEQKLGSDSGVTFFLTGKSDDYPALMVTAGLMGHRLYIRGTQLGLGVSGIGAFYDREVQVFLGTGNWVLYALAVGQ